MSRDKVERDQDESARSNLSSGQGMPNIRCVINLPNLFDFGKSFHVSADLSLLFVAISRKENIYIKKSQEIFL